VVNVVCIKKKELILTLAVGDNGQIFKNYSERGNRKEVGWIDL